MKIEQIYTGCLAQGAYYIVSEDQAAIIDPLREVQPYLDRLEREGARLKYIFETHFHADFVSGHLDLSKKTGAPIVYGPTAQPSFPAIIAKDEEIFTIGNVQVKVLHTPGHTLESVVYLLYDETRVPAAIFSGDTLFLGDVGRPDLAQKSSSLTKEHLAGMLYDSLYKKIMPLPDEVMVYPAHGAGSACGKKMQKETFDTLGNQKKINYALNQSDKESFIKKVLEGLCPPPSYFGQNVEMNKGGYPDFEEVKRKALKGLTPREFREYAQDLALVLLDTRRTNAFCRGFVPNSINIGLEGNFAPWVGALIADVKQPILLVTEEGKEEEAVTRLSRVGFDNVVGYLKGGIDSWVAVGYETDRINRISAEEFSNLYEKNTMVLDLRTEEEYAEEHLLGAENRPLIDIAGWSEELQEEKEVFIHCAGGYRSMIAASILCSKGIRKFKEIEGGISALKKQESKNLIFVP
ncbi:MAG: MBL fold metallo-hydrolase [Bergeyella sp.]|nr:MBL fold metallo-hydrolase [Bergeyella sp.]